MLLALSMKSGRSWRVDGVPTITRILGKMRSCTGILSRNFASLMVQTKSHIVL